MSTAPDKPTDRFSCPGCAADMEYDPATLGLKCPFCGQTKALDKSAGAGIPTHLLADFETSAATGTVSAEALQVNCSGCGSVIVFQPPEVAGSCAFCGALIVAQPKSADPLIAPDGVLPAAIPKTDATARVRQWLETRWFAPNELKKIARPEGIGGIYLPFWSYDAETFSSYRGERGEYYYVTEVVQERDDRGNIVNVQRQVRHTRWYDARGDVSHSFKDVLLPAAQSISRARLDALEPWGLESLQPFEPAYLSGFKAQRYQLPLPEGFQQAQQIMRASIDRDVRRDIGGDEQRVHNVDTRYEDVGFRHLLLPVWMGAYRFNGKIYQVLVNARTGEVQGERPYSVWKIVLLMIAILFIVWILSMMGRR